MERSQIPKYVMSTLCRICAEKSTNLTAIFENETLPLKIHKCLSIQVNKTDYLPLKVCDSCFFKINETYTLYIKADEADRRLKRLWQILLKETMVECPGSVEHNESAEGAVRNQQDVASLSKDANEMSCADQFYNIPKEAAYHNIEVIGDDCLVNGVSNEVMVISKAVSFEVISESVILKSLEKTNNQLETERNLQTELPVSNHLNSTKQNFCSQLKESQNEALSNESKGSKLHECQSDSYQSSSVACVTAHEPTNTKSFLCDTCGKFFKSAKYLKSHAKIHSKTRKKYFCKICSKGFLTNFFLQEHMSSHSGETPYKCPLCEKEFRERVHLRQHKWTHSTQKFTCPECGSKFNRKGNMSEHIKQFHRKGALAKPKKTQKENLVGTSTFECPTCSCTFPNQLLLQSHLKVHPEQKRFFCSICGKRFRHSGSLTYHRRTAHTGERPFQCGYCDKKFSLRSVQIIHERKAHTFEHPYKCTLCSHPFTNSSSLRNHMYIHTKDKMFMCDECGKKFSRSSNLIVHKKLHSGERKFACDQCGKSYIQRHDLLKHQRTHDPKSKPFFCKYCGNSFSRKKDSAKHTMCQFDFLRKKHCENYSAEKILDSVTSSLEKAGGNFSAEEEQQLFLQSVEELSGEKISKEIIYGGDGTLGSSDVKSDSLLS